MKRRFMKNKWVMATGILALALAHASSQSSGGGGGAGGGGTSGGGTAGGATTSTSGSAQTGGTVNQQGVQNPQQLPPGLQNRNQLPPGLQNREQLPPGLQRGQLPPGLAMRTNGVGLRTNEFLGRATNGFFTNRFAGGTNRFGSNTNLSPTGNSGTNRVFGTNHFDFRHFDRDRFRDHATTPTDQSLLIRIRQTITTEISISPSGGVNWIPIHIDVNNGQVSLFGLVSSADQAQRIQAAVSQMPGITGVQNGLSTLPQDQALTENDRVILTQIRQVIPQTPTGSAWMPLTFDVRQGTVGIAGIVPSTQESQRVETVVRQVPGVVQASNQLVVDTSSSSSSSSITPTTTIPQQ
jgi:osmotically-inducible protein OsmY